MIEGRRPELIIYQDERTIVFLSDSPLVKNHMIVAPKEHYTSLEQIPKDMISHFYFVASFASTAIYELLGGGDVGTNIILNEGKGSDRNVEHITLDVLPRSSDDGLNLRWEPQPAQEAALDDALTKIKDQTFFIGKGDHAQAQAPPASQQPERQAEKAVSKIAPKDKENYLIRQLNRIP